MNTFTLEPKLKSLNLGGMLQTLETRLSQAHDHQLGHVEFLEMLLEDEIGMGSTLYCYLDGAWTRLVGAD